MKLDDIASRATNDARESTQADTPPGVESIVVAARRQTRLRFVGTAVATVALVAIIIGGSGLVGRQTPAPEVTDMSVVSTTTSPTTPTTLPTTVPGVPVVPGLTAETAASVEALPHPGVTLLTEETLTNQIIRDLQQAVAGIEHQEEPTQISAAFEKNGEIHATVEYPSGVTALLVVKDGEVSRYRHPSGTWTDVNTIRKTTWLAYTRVTWVGLPDEAATAGLSTPSRPDIEDQAVIGHAAYFELAQLPWTQIGTLELFDENGARLMTEEVRIPGHGCSVAGLPTGDANMGIPGAVAETRGLLADALNSCHSLRIATQATGSGPYFDLAFDESQIGDTRALNDLAADLRDANMRSGLFRPMALALAVEPELVEGANGPIYLFSWTDQEFNRRVELGFTEDGTWQYGIAVDL